jgi:hypothetical protein
MNRIAELNAEREKLSAEILHMNTAVCKGKHDGGYPSKEFAAIMTPLSRELDKCLVGLIAELHKKGFPKFSKENVWLWGGPTPEWGGSMDKDTSVKGAEYFGLDNVVYVYGAIDEEAMEIHKNCKKLLCQLTQINRTPNAQRESNVENAEKLSRLSLQYPNLKGGIIDDLVGNYGYNISRAEVKNVYDALKKHNSAMKLYSVVYAHELDSATIKILAPYIDCVNLWVWGKYELPDIDLIIEKCLKAFPGKEIMMGVFMHDYGASDLGMPPELLEFQLSKARQYLSAGKINDLVILGDREIAKWPAIAARIKKFLDSQF